MINHCAPRRYDTGSPFRASQPALVSQRPDLQISFDFCRAAKKQRVEFFPQAFAAVEIVSKACRYDGVPALGGLIVREAQFSACSDGLRTLSNAESEANTLRRSEFVERGIIERRQSCLRGGPLEVTPCLSERFGAAMLKQHDHCERLYQYLVHNGFKASFFGDFLSAKYLPRVRSRLVGVLGAQPVGKNDCGDRSDGLHPAGPIGARSRRDCGNAFGRRRPVKKGGETEDAQAQHHCAEHQGQQGLNALSCVGHEIEEGFDTECYPRGAEW